MLGGPRIDAIQRGRSVMMRRLFVSVLTLAALVLAGLAAWVGRRSGGFGEPERA